MTVGEKLRRADAPSPRDRQQVSHLSRWQPAALADPSPHVGADEGVRLMPVSRVS
jgi:hypothetical protein